MRIVLLGGAGEIGSEVARDLAAQPEIESLVIADLDGGRAAELAHRLDRRGLSDRRVDIRDRESALELIAGADLLMNCASFVLFDDVFRLALEARVDYADLLSEPTADHRRAAANAGITAISGLGASPGLSNVLVRHASEELDELREVNISWISLRTIAPTPGLLDTILWELSEECPTRRYYQDGRHRRAAFLEGSRRVEFAPPVGRQLVYYVPHTEVTTLPRHFPMLRDCAVRGSWRPELMADLAVLERHGLLSPAAIESTKEAIWQRHGGIRDAAPWMLYVNVEVDGRRDGQPVRRSYNVSHPVHWGERGVARMTAVPAAVGAQLLARYGRIATGFVDPEEYYDPREFLETLGRRGGVTVERAETRVPAQLRQPSRA
ncbi:MAG: saccharopine dehydrogenase NADP-binding domain-containing protein [Solirubrobacterales bacterium]|nr:saccharopine dehydrogenase NADP-binding domain-containing protein [Solirubrobacterales bacterium]